MILPRAIASGIPRTVIALDVVSFLTDLSSKMIYPLLPILLATVLGAGAVTLGGAPARSEGIDTSARASSRRDIGLAALPASIAFGFLWQQWGAAVAFSAGAVLAALAEPCMDV